MDKGAEEDERAAHAEGADETDIMWLEYHGNRL